MDENHKQDIMGALRMVQDAAQGKDIVSLGLVSSVQCSEQGEVVVVIEVDPSGGGALV